MTIASGYQRDADSVFYVTGSGDTYLVYEPDAIEPLWRKSDDCLSPDSEPARVEPLSWPNTRTAVGHTASKSDRRSSRQI